MKTIEQFTLQECEEWLEQIDVRFREVRTKVKTEEREKTFEKLWDLTDRVCKRI